MNSWTVNGVETLTRKGIIYGNDLYVTCNMTEMGYLALFEGPTIIEPTTSSGNLNNNELRHHCVKKARIWVLFHIKILYKNKIIDSVFLRENTVQRRPVF